MGLKKYKLGELIELVEETNSMGKYGPKDVRGMTITKEIIPTKADVANTDLRKFLVVHPDNFVFNPRTHGKKIGFGFNNTKESFLISWNNIAFRVKPDAVNIVMPTYLFLHFNREEWDREACFCSWGSSTEVFSWEALCGMKLTLPSIEQQRKYVQVYLALQNNLAAYQSKVDDLKLVCNGYIEKLRKDYSKNNPSKIVRIGDYITKRIEVNDDGMIELEQGINIQKQFITPQRSNSNLYGRRIVRKGDIAYCTQLNNDNVAVAYRDGEDCVVSSVYDIIYVNDETILLPKYLMLWLTRSEFGRYVYTRSTGSAYEFLSYDDLSEYKIPLPDIKVQQAIVNIYDSFIERQRMAENLKEQLKKICPVLIRGSLNE